MIADRIGRHEVLLPLLIRLIPYVYSDNDNGNSLQCMRKLTTITETYIALQSVYFCGTYNDDFHSSMPVTLLKVNAL